jgi:RimJ/RimL family protein N-acetyltransferase
MPVRHRVPRPSPTPDRERLPVITPIDLTTPQITPLAQADLPLYLELHCSALVLRHIGQPLSQAAATLSFAAAMTSNARDWPSRYTWAVRRSADVAPAGVVALLPADPESEPCCAELGAIFLPSAHGQPFVGRSMLAVMAHAFAGLGVRTLTASHLDSHPVAMRVVGKLGFRPVSTGLAPIRRWRVDREDWLGQRRTRPRGLRAILCQTQSPSGVE